MLQMQKWGQRLDRLSHPKKTAAELCTQRSWRCQQVHGRAADSRPQTDMPASAKPPVHHVLAELAARLQPRPVPFCQLSLCESWAWVAYMSLEERKGKILRSVIVTCHASQFVKNDIDGRAHVCSTILESWVQIFAKLLACREASCRSFSHSGLHCCRS